MTWNAALHLIPGHGKPPVPFLDELLSMVPVSMDDTPKISGVYVFFHRSTRMVYVGSAKNLRSRRRKHVSDSLLRLKTTRFSAALFAYGESEFDYFIVELCSSKSELLQAEEKWITGLDATRLGFNTLATPTRSADGHIAEEATKRRIALAVKSHWADPEKRKARIISLKSAQQSPSAKAARLEWQKRPEFRKSKAELMRANRRDPAFVAKMRASMTPQMVAARTEKIKAAWTPEKRAAHGIKMKMRKNK